MNNIHFTDDSSCLSSEGVSGTGRGTSGQKVAVVVHFYYQELWPEVRDRLLWIDADFDLFVTVPSDLESLAAELVLNVFPSAKIRPFKNLGMDVLPFLGIIPELIDKDYSVVCKIHTKKGHDANAAIWRRSMLDSLIGTRSNFDQVVSAFTADPVLQIAGPGSFYQSVKLMMYGNRTNLEKTFRRIYGYSLPNEDWGFFMGTMFWVRPSALSRLAYYSKELVEETEHDVRQDGQVVHSLERIFGLIPVINNAKIGLLYPSAEDETGVSTEIMKVTSQEGIGYVNSPSLLLRNLVALAHNQISLKSKFDCEGYEHKKPALVGTGVDRLKHYLLHGQFSDLAGDEVVGGGGYFQPATQEQLLNSQIIDWHFLTMLKRPTSTCSVIIVFEGSREKLKKSICSLLLTQSNNLSQVVIVADDLSTVKGIFKGIEVGQGSRPTLTVVKGVSNSNTALDKNLGFNQCTSEYVFFLKSGVTVEPGWLDELVGLLSNTCISSVQARVAPDSDVNNAAQTIEGILVLGRALPTVVGACIGFKSIEFAMNRGFDAAFGGGVSEVDLGLRLNAYKSNKISWYAGNVCVFTDTRPVSEDGLYHVKQADHSIFRNRWAAFIESGVGGFRVFGTLGFELKPTSGLKEIAVSKQSVWLASVTDPCFRLLPIGSEKSIKPGWYRLTLDIKSTFRRDTAKFYFDMGRGWNEVDVWSTPYMRGVSLSRVFYLKDTAFHARFDPQEGEGKFVINNVAISSVGEREAINEIISRTRAEHPQFNGLKTRDIHRSAKIRARNNDSNLLDEFLGLYGETFMLPETDSAYENWIDTVELPSLPSVEAVKLIVSGWSQKPLISIVMPTYNTEEQYLRLCIESVLEQSYANWELCIADDASSNPNIGQILGEYQQRDDRIKVVYRAENGHISQASNSALKVATGDYIALLDHDDELAEHALFFMVEAINKKPDAKILYSDEDKITVTGERQAPHFKSDWNPDLFFSQNYVSHLGLYSHSLLKKIGGFREGVEGSQDQDLLLRCLPYVSFEEVVHVPKVLYHWRVVDGSTAMSADQKDYTTEAGIAALADYFSKHGPVGAVVKVGKFPNTYKVDYPIPEPAPFVSLLIPTRDRLSLVEVAVRSILEKSTYTNYEILILDNGSIEQETLNFFTEIQAEDKRVKVLRYDHPFNYSAINNFGVKHASGSIIGLVNNDVDVISENWLGEMVSHCCREEIGCVGAKLYYSNDTLQHGGVIVGLGGVAGHSHKRFGRYAPGYFRRLMLVQSLSAVTAACLMVRKEVYEQVGGLDEENLEIAFNDVDFCLKVREAGYRNLWTPYAELYHYESISRGAEDTLEKQARFASEVNYMQSKWGQVLALDPYYSPNLTLDREDFSITTRPRSPYPIQLSIKEDAK